MGWREHAACRGSDVALFYAGQGDVADNAKALAVCARCEVCSECLADALAEEGHSTVDVYGVRGGRLAVHRAAIIRRRRGMLTPRRLAQTP